MKIAVRKNHLGSQILYRSLDPAKNGVLLIFVKIALTGATAERRKVGEWFGPNTMAQVLRRITLSDKSLGISVSVAMDSVVCKSDIREEMEKNGNPILLIIPLRLGLETVNEIYIGPLMDFLRNKWCVGIMGGKPNQVKYTGV